jgi:hypothetical protein
MRTLVAFQLAVVLALAPLSAWAEEFPEAPRTSLWSGVRVGLLSFGGNFYSWTAERERVESARNLVSWGPVVELDVGVRLGQRYVPYVGIEYARVGAGHRFEGEADVAASSAFFAVGFRYSGAKLDRVGFLSDLSVGFRRVTVWSSTQSYRLTSFEILRLGLGAEIRLSRLVTLSPMMQVTSGVVSGADGDIAFASGQPDGLSHPPYSNGQGIAGEKSYLVLSIMCGVHFDLFASQGGARGPKNDVPFRVPLGTGDPFR